jgi:hypothetical protein
MPTAATTQIVAAVVIPLTLLSPLKMTPAPKKPMPDTIFAAILSPFTAGPVSIPGHFKAVAQKANWSMYQLQDGIVVVVYSTPQFGLMAIFENSKSKNLFDQTVSLNANEQIINSSFQFPTGEKIEYDVRAAKSKWVIKSVNQQPQNRDFDQWPLMDGDFNYSNFFDY